VNGDVNAVDDEEVGLEQVDLDPVEVAVGVRNFKTY
jgi:hypothetical protein